MNKNLKKLTFLGLLFAWTIYSTTQAATKTSCFTTADSEAWFGGLVITEYKCFDNDIEIPDTINWKKVTEIWKHAFENSVIVSVKLPNSLKQISEFAFADNIIEKLEIPEGVKRIEESAFKNNKLTAVKFPKTLNVIWDNAFASNKLSKLAVQSRLSKVWDWAFCENEAAEVIWVSESLEWTFQNACFKQIKASTVEDSYKWIETDYSSQLKDTLWEWIKTDSPEVNEITTMLDELVNSDTVESEKEENVVNDDYEIDTEEIIVDEENNEEDVEEINDEELIEELDDNEEVKYDINGSENPLKDWISFDINNLPINNLPINNLQIDEIMNWDTLWMITWFAWWLFWIIIALRFIVYIVTSLMTISNWEVYRKAGKKWWAFLIPIYNTIVYADIAETNKWLWIIPWLTAPLICLWLFFDLWGLVTWLLAGVLSLLSLILYIIWNYRVAKRYWRSTFASIIYVLFKPIAILFLWLWKFEYKPLKVTYDLNNPQVNEPEKITPAPIVATEQLNNVVEHFVWPEEEKKEENATVEENITQGNKEITNEKSEEYKTESKEVVAENMAEENINEPTTEVENENQSQTNDVFDNRKTFADTNSTTNDDTSDNETKEELNENWLPEDFYEDTHYTEEPVWDVLNNEESNSENTNVENQNINDDNVSSNSLLEENNIEEIDMNNEAWNNNQEAIAQDVQVNEENNDIQTQDVVNEDKSMFNNDALDTTVEQAVNKQQTDSVANAFNQDTINENNYPEEPISDLDELMANNNK